MKMLLCFMLLFMGTTKGDSPGKFDVPEIRIFSASINCLPSYQSTHNITCSFHLKNNGDDDYSVLLWHTPLDGLNSDCLKVTRNGQKLHYDGIFAKRSMPAPEEFILVAAGQTVSSTFDVSVAYDMSTNGNYSVVLDTYIEYAVGSVESMNVAGKPGIHTKIAHLSSPAVTFLISGGGSSKRTLGQRARSLERLNERTSSISDFIKRTNAPQEAVVVGNSALNAETKQVHRLAYDSVVSAISEIESNRSPDRFNTWFGKRDQVDLAYPLLVYQLIKQVLKRDTITYVYESPMCENSWFGFTYYGTRKIYLCLQYKLQGISGMGDSKLGTVIHELTHAIGYTSDYAYGTSACRYLATSSPSKAVDNGDNYCYFISSM